MSPAKSDGLTLASTASGQSPFPGALERFQAFLRSEDGLEEDDDEDEVSPLEMEFKFLVRTKDIDSMTVKDLEDLGRDFFSLKYKMSLDNRVRRAELEQAMKKVGTDEMAKTKELLVEARQEKFVKINLQHDKWIAKLKTSGVIQDRSGETFFTGWLVK